MYHYKILVPLLLGLFVVGLPLQAGADTLAPFTSDGCSAFPDGTLAQNELWLECCHAHDYAYWKGGTYSERLEADEALERCVAGVGEEAVAKLMLAGVRVGGSPYFPTAFRWGYGWPWSRGYQALSPSDWVQIRTYEERAGD
ncbi:MAG TPA: FAD-binding oxidoreductase [Cellvibrionaceae bacterium]